VYAKFARTTSQRGISPKSNPQEYPRWGTVQTTFQFLLENSVSTLYSTAS